MSALSAPAHADSPSTLKRFMSAHPLISFFVLAFAGSWGIILGAVLSIGSGALTEESPVFTVLQNLGPFGPALAGLIAAAITGGRRGLRDLLASLDPRRIRPIWFVLALFAPPLALVLAEAVVYGSAPLVGMAEQWQIIFTRYLPTVLTIVLVTTGIAEELGWRGFAQPRLQLHYGPLAGSLILGTAAALWHLPNALLTPGGLPVFALQALYTIIVAVLFTWVYNRNHGSTLIVALFHAALNTSSRLVYPLVPSADPVLRTQHIYIVTVAVVSLVALLLIIATRGRLGLAPSNGSRAIR